MPDVLSQDKDTNVETCEKKHLANNIISIQNAVQATLLDCKQPLLKGTCTQRTLSPHTKQKAQIGVIFCPLYRSTLGFLISQISLDF